MIGSFSYSPTQVVFIRLGSGRIINFNSVVSFEQNKDGKLELMLPTGEIISTDKYNLSTFERKLDVAYGSWTRCVNFVCGGINYIDF